MKSSRSPIFALADTYISESAALSPIGASFLGITEYDDKLDDFSLAGWHKKAEHVRGTLEKLAALNPIDDVDRIAKAVMLERLESEMALLDSGERQLSAAVISSPVVSIRQVFEVMPAQTPREIKVITARLNKVGEAHKSWLSALDALSQEGKTPARRQIEGIANQLDSFSKGSYSGLATRFDPEKQNPQLHEAARAADASAGETADWLRNTFLARTQDLDAVGVARFALWASHYTGAKLDLRATYEWGMADLAQINERMWRVARTLLPEAKTLREVADALEIDPKYQIKGTEALLNKLKEFTAKTTEEMDGIHFDIDERIKFCDVKIAPEGSAAAPYYISPSEDLTRPGTTWFSTQGKNTFSWWRLPSMWFHEAVPGHHLQSAIAIIQQESLSRFQRTEAWTSGYGEGWALYAERLMDELGGYDDPATELGFLAAQAWRAARVVLDIGLHLGYENYEGQVWDAQSAVDLMMSHVLLDEGFAKSEVERYLGIPGQAISYKVGERVWMRAREDAKARLDAEFSLKKFHSFALKLGPMGLDPFEAELSQWSGN
ncbi:MAG: DUF885 domain-containing protein [Actinobacteria bacterium]|nr:DUF885 domain-containing protein [Actinomycetota bacterium]